MSNHYAILRRERTEALKVKRRIYGDRGGISTSRSTSSCHVPMASATQ